MVKTFGNMKPEKHRAVSSVGGKAAHAQKRRKKAYEWDSEAARAAGLAGAEKRRKRVEVLERRVASMRKTLLDLGGGGAPDCGCASVASRALMDDDRMAQ